MLRFHTTGVNGGVPTASGSHRTWACGGSYSTTLFGSWLQHCKNLQLSGKGGTVLFFLGRSSGVRSLSWLKRRGQASAGQLRQDARLDA